MTESVIIVGGGPAGYTAALYAARADLNPLVIEGFAWGGLLQQTTDVENFPGFPGGVAGPELMASMRAQAERFGARLLTENADAVELASVAGAAHTVRVGERTHRTRALIIATGADHHRLGIPGEAELAGRGVSYCATCDAAFFRDKRIIVIGGGDSAMEEAIFLAKFGEVTVVHRRDEFRASRIMLDRARGTENLQLLTPYQATELRAGESGTLSEIMVRHAQTGEEKLIAADGCFIAVGHRPNSELVAGQLPLDGGGYIQTQDRSSRTSRPGVFACGDVVDHTYRQAITAAGSGCQAALDAEWFLRDTPQVPTPPALRDITNPAEEQWGPYTEEAGSDE